MKDEAPPSTGANLVREPTSNGASPVWLDWMYREPAIDAPMPSTSASPRNDAAQRDVEPPASPALPLAS
jgi:hypothetical protein